jgi:hypothetical protein
MLLTRARQSPTCVVSSVKGDGETHPVLTPDDEFAAFERWDKGNLDLSTLKKPEMLQFEYARQALENGLVLEQRLGTNPYKFGMIGSTDSHTGLSTADDENFWGQTSASEPSPDRATIPSSRQRRPPSWGGSRSRPAMPAVWAMENTREALFDAMERKETYATTGPRMVVRFFGGWDFQERDAQDRLPARVGYTKGVPMGGDLKRAPRASHRRFSSPRSKTRSARTSTASRSSKAWVTKDGKTQEKIHDVAWGGDRKPGADGKLRRSATRSMCRTRPTPTPSAPRS